MAVLARDPKLELLAGVPLLAGLGRRQLRRVGALLDVTSVPAGHVLTREGDRAREFFVLLDGTATVARAGEVVATLGRGDVVGEMGLVDDDRRSATVTAASELELLVGDRRAFTALLATDTDLRRAVLGTAVERERANAA